MIRAVFDDIRLSFAFLTRLPISIGADGSANGALARAMWAFPLVGILTGGVGGVTFWIATDIGLSLSIASVLAVTAMIAATGALHEDGLADMADASGGATRERKLEIMKDSRIGTYGVVALVLALLFKVSAILDFAALTNSTSVVCLLIAAATVSRCAIVAISYALPHAKPDGLSALAGRPTLAILIIAIALALIVTLASLPLPLATTGIAGSIIGTLSIIALARHQIGGQTGDILGASQQIAEIGFLIGVLISLR